VLEGVAMNLLTGLQAFEEQGHRIERIDAIGGGGRSDRWLQICADVWGKPVRRRSLVDEANALGAAVVGGVATGIYRDFSVAGGFTDVESTFSPEPDAHSRYRRRYEQFLDAYSRLEPLFEQL
jgi:xylulokinase